MASIKLSQIHNFALGQHLSEWGDKPYDEVISAMVGVGQPEVDLADWSATGVIPWEPFEDYLPRYLVSWIGNTVYVLRGLFESAGVEVLDDTQE